MKRYLYFPILALVLFISCSPYPREKERMAAAMEQAESIYGDGNLLIEVDTALFVPGLSEAPAYYAHKKQFGKAALAALYNGYAEKDFDKELAMSSFKDAERYGEMVHDSLTVARAEYHMGKMLYYDGLYKESLTLNRIAYSNFGNRINDQSFILNGMATSYIMLAEFDSAATCLDLSLDYAEMGQCVKAKRKALNNYAILHKLTGNYDMAIECLRQVRSEDIKEQLLNYLNLGDIFNMSGEIDSARYYYQLVESHLDESNVKPETKLSAYGLLSRFAEAQGDYATALNYRKLYDIKLYEIQKEIGLNKVYHTQQKYDYEVVLNSMKENSLKRQRIILWLSVATSIVVIALGIAMVRLAKIQKQEADLKASLIHFTEQNRELSGQNETYKTELEKSKEKLSKVLTKEHHIIQKLALYLDNPSDKSLLQALKHTVWGGKEFWPVATIMFDNKYPGAREKLLKGFPDLSEQELKTLILLGLDASREDTALLLHTSIHMVDKLRNSVKKKATDYKV